MIKYLFFIVVFLLLSVFAFSATGDYLVNVHTLDVKKCEFFFSSGPSVYYCDCVAYPKGYFIAL